MSEQEITLRIHSISWETNAIRNYELRSWDGGVLPSTAPGSHVNLKFRNGLRRSYSLTRTGVALSAYHLSVLRETVSRGGSAYLHDHARVGDPVTVEIPPNKFQLEENAEATLFL